MTVKIHPAVDNGVKPGNADYRAAICSSANVPRPIR